MSQTVRRFRYFGEGKEITPLARAIMEEDIAFLESSLGRDWSLDEPFPYCEGDRGDLAIALALVENKESVVEWLLSKGANLNAPESPAMVSAVSSLNTALMDRIIAAGASVHARNRVGYNSLDQAVAWEHFALVPYLEEKGLSLKDDKGRAFHSAVFAGNIEFAEYALKKGADPNIPEPLDRAGSGMRPLHKAVMRENLPMIQLLIQYGADPTLPDIQGLRPYTLALIAGDIEIVNYLREIEPSSLHDPEVKRALAQIYRVPPELLAFMKHEDRWLKDGNGNRVVEFLALADIYEIRWKRRIYLALSQVVDDEIECGDLVWCKRKKQVCMIDFEHDKLFKMGSWTSFAADPMKAIDRLWADE